MIGVQQVPVNQAVDDGTRIGGASQSSITVGLSYRLAFQNTLKYFLTYLLGLYELPDDSSQEEAAAKKISA